MIPHDVHLQIGSLLFEGIDQIDLTGPFEVLSRIPNSTNRIYAKTAGAVHMAYAPEPPFNSGTPETAPRNLRQARQSVRGITAQREATARRVAARLGVVVPS